MERRITRGFKIGNIGIGSNYPISIQSMLKVQNTDVEGCLNQIKELENVHCDLIRVSVPDENSLKTFEILQKNTYIPLIADIHYSYDLAYKVLELGAKKIRMNPGNMPNFANIEKLVAELKNNHTCIRIGVNSGSINKAYENLNEVDKIVNSTLDCLKVFENLGFHDIVLGLKSSSIETTIECNEKIAKLTDYPMHIGLTESGPLREGLVKSTIAISKLLEEGIGDTIRVSLSSSPVEEVNAAKTILKSLGLKKDVPELVSCPTCARTKINVQLLSEKIEKELMKIDKDVKIAVMGCPLNGIDEGKDADLGIAGGEKESIIFVKGKQVARISNENMVEEFMAYVHKYLEDK